MQQPVFSVAGYVLARDGLGSPNPPRRHPPPPPRSGGQGGSTVWWITRATAQAHPLMDRCSPTAPLSTKAPKRYLLRSQMLHCLSQARSRVFNSTGPIPEASSCFSKPRCAGLR